MENGLFSLSSTMRGPKNEKILKIYIESMIMYPLYKCELDDISSNTIFYFIYDTLGYDWDMAKMGL